VSTFGRYSMSVTCDFAECRTRADYTAYTEQQCIHQAKAAGWKIGSSDYCGGRDARCPEHKGKRSPVEGAKPSSSFSEERKATPTIPSMAPVGHPYCKERNPAEKALWCTASAGHAGNAHAVHHLDGTPNVAWVSVPIEGEQNHEG